VRARERMDEPTFRDDAFRRAIVASAIRAPSGDNCQPWHFRFVGDRVYIDLVRERSQSFFDYRDRASLLSIGAVIENMRVQAACLGVEVSVSYPHAEFTGDEAVARVAFTDGFKADAQACARLSAVHLRTVNRRPYLPMRIDASKQQEWTADMCEGVDVTIIEDRATIAKWARITYLADRIRWTHPTIHRELFSTIRYSRRDALRERTGLEIERLGAGPLAVPLMRLLAPWSRMARMARVGFDAALANHTRMMVLCAGALVLVSLKGEGAADWIRAGEQVQRLWVTAQHQGLCVQPVPVALYLDQRFQSEGTTDFEPAHRRLLAEIRRELGILVGDRVGAMIYRVGIGPRMRDVAIRLPAAFFHASDAEVA
jgi:nitroreductase